MRISKKERAKRRNIIIWTVVIIIIILLGIGYWYFYKDDGQTNSNTTDTDSSETIDSKDSNSTNTSGDTSSGQDVKPTSDQDSPKHMPIQNGQESDDNTSNDSGNDTSNSPKPLTGIVNYKNVTKDSLVLKVTINGQHSGGACDLTLTNNASGKKATKQANIVQMPGGSGASACMLTVPTSNLSSGKWNITIDLTDGNETGKITDTVNI